VRRALVAALCLAAPLSLTGCAPGTPDDDSWRVDAERAVSDALSAVRTAELALRQSEDGRVYDPYLQTVLVDAEEAVGGAADTIGAGQPPRPERERFDAVTGQIGAAEDLVTAARIAVVDGESYRYDGLADSLADAGDALESLESDLEHPVR
jgi:hypothetical protein